VNIYADTSWWLAYKCRGDIHHAPAISLFESQQKLLPMLSCLSIPIKTG